MCLQHAICKTKTVIYETSKREACINLASAGNNLQKDILSIILSYALADILGRVFLVRNQYLVTTLGAPGYRITIIWANSADEKKKKKKKSLFPFFLTKKTGFDSHAMETICMKCKSCFLGRMRKYFKMSSVENFTQGVRRYGLHKQIAHWSVHGKTYNKTCTKRWISLHTLSLHISSLIRAFANRMYLQQSLGLTKRLVRRAKTRVNLPTAHSDKSIR